MQSSGVVGQVEVFVHPALLYRTVEQYLAGLVPFVTEGLVRGDAVAVAVPRPRLRQLRQALGPHAEHVALIDMAEAGRNPGRIIASVLSRFADAQHDRAIRIVGEPIWAQRNALEYPACAQHEALINSAFAGRALTIVCPYDTGALDAAVIADAYRTHPEVWEGDRRFRSSSYAPQAVLERYNHPVPPGAGAEEFSVDGPDDVRLVRHAVTSLAERQGLSAARIPDLELIVTELVTNSLDHTSGGALLRIWTDAQYLVCEVHDHGFLADPLSGRRLPAAGQFGGRGLLLVHQLADLVRIHSTPQSGTSIYAFVSTAI